MTSHYEQRLEKDLTRIKRSVVDLADRVEAAVRDSVQALMTGDRELANRTALGDQPINRSVSEIDRLCHAFIALHLPSAGPLRLITAVIRTNIALERIGDYAVTISREAALISQPPEGLIARETELMAAESIRGLHQAITAFRDFSPQTAKATKGFVDQTSHSFSKVFDEFAEHPDKKMIADLLAQFVVLNMLERVSDQAKNICEDVVFATTGESKPPPRFKIIFLDKKGACHGPMAMAVAQRSFPNSGEYSSACLTPASDLHTGLEDFLVERGMEAAYVSPIVTDLGDQALFDLHVAIALEGRVEDYFEKLPFHTTALEWPLDELISAGKEEPMTLLYRELGLKIRDLMHLLRGEDAD